MNDDDASVDDGDSDSSSSVAPRVLPARSTRGQRLSSMHGEGDDEFWSQEFFTAEDADGAGSDYEQSDSSADETDSDFDEVDDAEADDDDRGDVDATADDEEGRARKKRRGGYVDPRGRNSASTSTLPAPRAARSVKSAATAAPTRASVRTSTLQSAIATANRSIKSDTPARTAKRGYVVLSQEEQLAAAVDTERSNAESLAQLIRIETISKTAPRAPQAQTGSARIRYVQTRDSTSLTFINCAPTIWTSQPREPPRTCVVSGQSGRYLHPQRKVPFHDVQAYNAIHDPTAANSKQHIASASSSHTAASSAASAAGTSSAKRKKSGAADSARTEMKVRVLSDGHSHVVEHAHTDARTRILRCCRCRRLRARIISPTTRRARTLTATRRTDERVGVDGCDVDGVPLVQANRTIPLSAVASSAAAGRDGAANVTLNARRRKFGRFCIDDN